MGASIFKASYSCFDKPKPVAPNPDPSNYKILKWSLLFEPYLVIEIQYPDCTNYEGRKILVFKTDLGTLLAQKQIDPHFSESKKFLSPIARFEPTASGWLNASIFAATLANAQ